MTEYGISKARCANSSVQRISRFEDDDTHPNKFKKSSSKDHTKKESPKSLLQLFESELSSAKNSTRESTCNATTIMQPPRATHDGCFSKRAFLKVDRPYDYLSDIGPQHPEQIYNSSHSVVGQAVDGIEQVIAHLQKLKSDPEQDRSCQHISHILQLGLSAALESFSACVQSISETVQSSLGDKNCSTEDLQKLLTTLRCSRINFAMPLTSDSGSGNSLQPHAHSQTRQVSGTSKDDEVYPHGSMKVEGRSGSRHSSGNSKVQDGIEGSASLTNALTMSPSPYDGVSLGNELLRDAADTLAKSLPPYGGTPRDHYVANVLPQPRDFARISKPRSEILDFPYKVPHVPYGAPGCSYSIPGTSHNDELCHGTLSQMTRFPPLPTMEPLIPAYEAGPSKGEIGPAKDLRFPEDLNPLGSVAIRQTRAIGSKATNSYETESSGQFFNRMTGRGNGIAMMSGSEPACNYGIGRRATIGEGSEGCSSSNWRTFTTESSENACMPQDSASQRLQTPVRPQACKPRGSDGRANAATSNQITTKEGGRKGGLADLAYAIDHSDDTTAGKIQECVEQLQTLGFGNNTTDALGRLIVYAQAAEGNLSSAIDLIDEEQRAYSLRR